VKPAIAGQVAIDVAHQLAEPLRSLRDRLGLVVDHLERHVATATGPTPYPWRSLTTLRQDLSAAYLEVTHLARRMDELDRALDDAAEVWFDLAAAIDHGLHLAAHHLGTDIELLVDLGQVAVLGVPGTLALMVAQLVAVSARSARAAAGSSLSVRATADGALIIADNGAGDDAAIELGELVRAIISPWGATIEAASEPGKGCAFELRFVMPPES